MCCLSELIDVGQRGDPGQNGFPSADAKLRHTVLTYIHERYSELPTAASLFMHCDSLHGRLAQADELLPQPLDPKFTSRWHWRS